jgi:hypothetical protein
LPSETSRDLITGDVEFGPIIKLIELKIYFCLYILQGVGYWVDDRTLVAEEAIFVNTAQALSLLLKTISDLFGISS